MRRQVLELESLRNGIYGVLVRPGMNHAVKVRPLMRATKFALSLILLFLLLVALLQSVSARGRQQQQAPPPQQQQQTPTPTTPQQQQQAPTPPKIAVETNMVTVAATVRDKKGEIISNLTKDDFALDEDGRPQTVSYFARENDLPLTVGLLVDTSMSQRRLIDQERVASASFVDHSLREEKKDQAFLIHFDYEVELLQDLTPSHKKLDDALRELQTPELEDTSQSQGGGGQSGGGHHGGGTLLYDAVFLASDDLMKKQQGRKALIILSDGVDHGSKESLSSAIESAQRANTVVYSILFKDEQSYGSPGGYGHHGGMGGGGYPGGGYPGGGYPGGGGGGGRRYPQQEQRPDGKKILDRISKETGGRLFEVTKKQSVDQIYDLIQQDLRAQYILGYVPDKSPTSADYRKIHLTIKQKDLIVQARDGYYADQQAPAPTPAAAATKSASGN